MAAIDGRVVITGGAGFIGSHLCERFLGEGARVVCVDNLVTGRQDNVAHLRDEPEFEFVHADVTKGIRVDGPVDAVLHFASPERDDSLRAMIAIVAAPSGSNLNPARLDDLMIQAPTVPEDGIVRASLERSGSEGESMLAFSAVITREGNISGVELLGDGRSRLQVARFIDEISRGRLEPARYGTDPVAVNLIWFVEHMTVKAKLRG